MHLQEKIKEYALELGADIIGFCAFDTPPSTLAPHLIHAVSLGVKLSDSVLKTIEDSPTFVYFQHYRTANALLDQIAFRLARVLEENGYEALPIAASQSQGKNNPYNGVVPHKTVAVRAGLGFVGKSGLFLSEKYGSRVRLATVLTNAPFTSELPVIENGCGDCDICFKSCPAGAIFGQKPTKDGERNIDAEKCSRYMKEKFQDVGRGSVCGICIKVCPKNKLQ